MDAASERTTLLHSAGPQDTQHLDIPSRYGTDIEDGDNHKQDASLHTTIKKEVQILARYSAPLVLTYVLQYSYSFVTVLVAGRLGADELAASSLASMTANITGLCVYEGMATCLDTLTSQAYGGGKKHLVGLHVQRMIAMTLLMTVPIGAFWICSPWILERLVPEKEVAQLAGTFLRIYLIGAPGYGVFEAGKRFTQAQGDFTASLVVLLICAPLNILWNWLFVFHLNLGFVGAALAVVFSLNLQPIMLFLYIYFIAPSTLQCWPGLSIRRSFQNWGPMLKLAGPGILMVETEWLAFDILTISASYLGTKQLAAQSVLMTCSVTMFHIPFPTAIAASTRFGNLIGRGALDAAWLAWKAHYLVFIGIGITDIILLTSLRHVIALAFTIDEEVRQFIIAVLPIVAAAQLFDALTALSNGLIRGLGRQKIGGWVNLMVYYLFSVPMSLGLTFGNPRLGLWGLWIGPLIGLGIVSLVLVIYMRLTDWSKAVEEAREREE